MEHEGEIHPSSDFSWASWNCCSRLSSHLRALWEKGQSWVIHTHRYKLFCLIWFRSLVPKDKILSRLSPWVSSYLPSLLYQHPPACIVTACLPRQCVKWQSCLPLPSIPNHGVSGGQSSPILCSLTHNYNS